MVSTILIWSRYWLENMTVGELYCKVLGTRVFASFEAMQCEMLQVLEFGRRKRLISERAYLEGAMLHFRVCPHVPVTFRRARSDF
jgi:hypothetical protein